VTLQSQIDLLTKSPVGFTMEKALVCVKEHPAGVLTETYLGNHVWKSTFVCSQQGCWGNFSRTDKREPPKNYPAESSASKQTRMIRTNRMLADAVLNVQDTHPRFSEQGFYEYLLASYVESLDPKKKKRFGIL